jgi:hypothetical protein
MEQISNSTALILQNSSEHRCVIVTEKCYMVMNYLLKLYSVKLQPEIMRKEPVKKITGSFLADESNPCLRGQFPASYCHPFPSKCLNPATAKSPL